MAIQFARIEIVSRSSGGNACCKGAYNARSIVNDQKTNITYNFSNRGDNVFHAVLLPEGVDPKFKNISELMNAIEHIERKTNSQLLKDAVIALPDDKELDLADRIEITKRIIAKQGWIEQGLAIQVDIHEPHDDEKNWHAHLLITTRRFTEDGKQLYYKKARDLNPEFKTGKYGNFIVPEETLLQHNTRDVINEYFKELGLENRVDAIGLNPQDHVGPVRMRSVMNAAAERNEEKRITEIEHLNSGRRVLDKVTRHMSTFTKGDLMRAVKCVPDQNEREKLVEEALVSKSIIALYEEDNVKTQFYTTAKIRSEEQKILRLSHYVANTGNGFKLGDKEKIKVIATKIEEAKDHLTIEQHQALTELLISDLGLGILRGRAGSGKSHVLRQIAIIGKAAGIEVIGLSPTHKAKEALANDGFERVDTVKGMLFKLHNARFELPKHSLLVVDEAGMIGNDDYKELLRVAATRKCHVILAGDERQLASVQRGGMFEVFADKYGSSAIMDIRRQDSVWGKAVAMAFSEGDAKSGIAILEQEQRINWHGESIESMQALLSDWNDSQHARDDRLILAVTNKDVAALNHGAREYLKAAGLLTGKEIKVGDSHYMKGDRILIQQTNKKLGLINGAIGEVLEASEQSFRITMMNDSQKGDNSSSNDNVKIIEFDPSQYNRFRHGYATTIFKAQGASIKDVYVYHGGFAGMRNSYVALSRNISELKLYVNNQMTRNIGHLISQLSYDAENGSSLRYLTKKELDNKALDGRLANHQYFAVRAINSAMDFVSRTTTKLTDKYLPSSEYYNYQEPKHQQVSVSQVIDQIYKQNEESHLGVVHIEEKKVVGGVSQTNVASQNNQTSQANQKNTINDGSIKLSAKNRFYQKIDAIRDQAIKAEKIEKINKIDLKPIWDEQTNRLKHEASFRAESIAKNLLGEPNKKLSNGRELRFGENGKIVVRITGQKAGTWYDFSASKGGDIFSLIQEKNGCDFKGAIEYLGGTTKYNHLTNHLAPANDHISRDITAKYLKEKIAEQRAEKSKQAQVDKLYARSKEIIHTSTASRYLVQTRKIDLRGQNNSMLVSDDIRSCSIYEKSVAKTLPAMVAFARDRNGVITGGQQILLNSKNVQEADVIKSRLLFGEILGSFVEVSDPSQARIVNQVSSDSKMNQEIQNFAITDNSTNYSDITIITEDLEAAMSIQYANLGAKIKCALDINNIKNYVAQENEKIIIATNNDGENSITNKATEKAKYMLLNQKAIVKVVKPVTLGSFTDILQRDEAVGAWEIRSVFASPLRNLGARNLEELFYSEVEHSETIGPVEYKESAEYASLQKSVRDRIQDALTQIRQYSMPEERILNEMKHSYSRGLKELAHVTEQTSYAEICYDSYTDIIKDIEALTGHSDKMRVIHEFANLKTGQALIYLEKKSHQALKNYLGQGSQDFEKLKNEASNLEELFKVIGKEQEFLTNIAEDYPEVVKSYFREDNRTYMAINVSKQKPELLVNIQEISFKLQEQGVLAESEIIQELKATINMEKTYISLDQKLEDHHIKTNLASFEVEKSAAKKTDDMLIAVDKEQNFLADLHNNLKYPEQQSQLINRINTAYEQKSEQVFEKLEKVVTYSLSENIKSSKDIMQELSQTKDLQASYLKLDQETEKYNLEKSLSGFITEKLAAKSVEEITVILAKEQGYLLELEHNFKYPSLIDYKLHKSIIEAHNIKENNILPLLQSTSENSIKSSFKDKDSVIKELQQTTNLQDTYLKLDQGLENHYIKTNIDDFAKEKLEVKSLTELLPICAKEQKFMAELHNNIKYPEQQSEVLQDSIKQAYQGEKDKLLPRLDKTIIKVIDKNLRDESIIIKELQQTIEVKSTYLKLDKALENHEIKSNLNAFAIKKEQIKTLPEMLQVIAKEQKFMAELYNNIKYPEMQEQKFINSINNAHLGQQNNFMQDLQRLTDHINQKTIMKPNDLLDHLRNQGDVHDTAKSLTQSAQAHYSTFVSKNITTALNEQKLEIHGKTFDCPMKYLQHEIDNPAHAYADIAKFKRTMPRLQEQVKVLELQKEKEYTIGGMSL